MDNKKYMLSAVIDEENVSLIDTQLDDFSKGARLDDKAKERILSSVMRKAGMEMDKNITVKQNKRVSKRFIGFAAAAAIMVTGAVGAGAAYVISGRTSNDTYFGTDADSKLESIGAKADKTISLEHFDLNIESMLCDGQYISVTASAVANDEEGAKWLSSGADDMTLHSSISERPGTAYSRVWDEDVAFISEDGKELLRWTYFLDEPKDKVTVPMSLIYMDYINGGDEKSLGEFELEFVKNLDTIKLENAKGECVSLSSNSVTGNGVTIEAANDPLPFREVSAEYKDGTVKKIEVYGCNNLDTTENAHYDKMGITFNDLVDIDNVSKLTIGRTVFELKG